MRDIAGDSHNFGRRVEVRGGRIWKPRALFWEWLFLSARSPLRRILQREGRGAFDFLPDLKFFSPRTLEREGEVELLSLAPLGALSPGDRLKLAKIVGRSLALWSFFGTSDLHWENLALGRDREGRIIFSPVDVELVLSDLTQPSETKLLPAGESFYREASRHAAGVRRALGHLGKPVAARDVLAIANDYRATLSFLQSRGRKIAALLKSLPTLRRAPIRICLRATEEYARALRDPRFSIWPPLLPEESAQLLRGDVPYFFHRYGRPGVHYFTNAARTRSAKVAAPRGMTKSDPVLELSRALNSPSRRALFEQGLFTILAAFDSALLDGRHAHGDLEANFGARFVTLTFSSGGSLRAKRDLRKFVSSVYLSCACGENRAVFARADRRCAFRY